MKDVWLFVLAGGSGTRFWPRSRSKLPKQLQSILGERSLLAETIHRFKDEIPTDRVVVLTTEFLQEEVRRDLAGFSGVHILAEPVSKNTAPSIVFGMEWLRDRSESAIAMVVPADHWITEIPEYVKVMKCAARVAKERGALCTIGIQPTRPETGFGYIRSGDLVEEGVFTVGRFVEKPTSEVAETLIQSPEYLWNAGMFVWPVSSFFKELKIHTPELEASFRGLYDPNQKGEADPKEIRKCFELSPNISIDYALLEKSKNVMVVPGSLFGWNDLGSFVALEEVFAKCEGGVGNAKMVMAFDSIANIIDAPGKTVALLGVTDLIVVDTGDVLLVASKERAQEVKRFVERLKAEGRTDLV